MANLTNKLRWKAQLLALGSAVDDDDRPIQMWLPERDLRYEEIGVTATEQYLAAQAKTQIALRILVRYDKRITQKRNRVKIGEDVFKLVRVYTERDDDRMELSLAYVDGL